MPKTKPSPSTREVVARNLRLVRLTKNLSQEQVALAAGIGRSYLSKLERNTINFSVDQLDALAKAVGVPVIDLVNPNLSPDWDGTA